MLHVGDVYYYSKNKFREIKAFEPSINFAEVIQQKDEVVQYLRKSKYMDVLQDLPNAVLIEGKAVFISKNEVKIGNEVLRADKFLIATGSSPNIIRLKGIDKVDYLAKYRMVKKLRENVHLNQIRGRLKGVVEMDETYVTAGLKGKRGSSILEGQASESGGGAPTSTISPPS